MEYFLNNERFQKKKNEKEFVQYIHAIAGITVKDFINLANYKIYVFNRIVWEVIINGSINNATEISGDSDGDKNCRDDYGQTRINDELNRRTKEIIADLDNIKNTALFYDANEALFNIQKKIYGIKNEIFTEMEDIKRQLIKTYKLKITMDGEKLAFDKNKHNNKTSKSAQTISENNNKNKTEKKIKNKNKNKNKNNVKPEINDIVA
jgi:hypothetical protein